MSQYKYKCHCCGYYTLTEADGNYEICPVCFWEDDPVQNEDVNLVGGANEVSLLQARINFASFGACEERFVSRTREPLDEEKRD